MRGATRGTTARGAAARGAAVRIATALMAAPIAAGLLMLTPAPAVAGGPEDGPGLEVRGTESGYHVNTSTNTVPPGGPSDGGPSRPPEPDEDGYFWKTEVGQDWEQEDETYWWNCNDTRTGECGFTRAGCMPEPGGDGRPRVPHFRLRQHVDWIENEEGWPEPDGQWEYVQDGFDGFECVPIPDEDWVDIEVVAEEIDWQVIEPLGEPNLTLSPQPLGYVNLPFVVSTDYPEDLPNQPGSRVIIESLDPVRIRVPFEIVRANFTVSGDIVADADFTWSFQDGGTAKGRGRPYEPGTDPRDHGGYYVTNTFEEPGVKTVNLDVLWTGTAFVDGVDPQEVGEVELNASEQVEIAELNPVGVGN